MKEQTTKITKPWKNKLVKNTTVKEQTTKRTKLWKNKLVKIKTVKEQTTKRTNPPSKEKIERTKPERIKLLEMTNT